MGITMEKVREFMAYAREVSPEKGQDILKREVANWHLSKPVEESIVPNQ